MRFARRFARLANSRRRLGEVGKGLHTAARERPKDAEKPFVRKCGIDLNSGVSTRLSDRLWGFSWSPKSRPAVEIIGKKWSPSLQEGWIGRLDRMFGVGHPGHRTFVVGRPVLDKII
eukprot:Gb_33805 [translate_table: standard]